jgi:hypothetical protein
MAVIARARRRQAGEGRRRQTRHAMAEVRPDRPRALLKGEQTLRHSTVREVGER